MKRCTAYIYGIFPTLASAILLSALLTGCETSVPENTGGPESPDYSPEDISFDSRLQEYAGAEFGSAVELVDISSDVVRVSGRNESGKPLLLAEVPPFKDLLKPESGLDTVRVGTGDFSVTVPRYTVAGTTIYDRMLSKWALMDRNAEGRIVPASFARFATEIPSSRDVAPVVLKNKKGLGGIINCGYVDDFDELGIGSATINLFVTAFTYTGPGPGRIPHKYCGRTYWFDKNYLEKQIDYPLKVAAERGMAVAGILLVGLPSSCADPELSKVINHPDCNGGNLTYPDITDPEGVDCFAAITDFLAERYTRPDGSHGRISHWIVMNEIDAPTQWANIGPKPMYYNADYYVKLLRIVHNIVRRYDSCAEIFASFTHSWTKAAGDFPGKPILEYISTVCRNEGDFRWALAHHPYPWDLLNPRSWDCPLSTFSMDSPCISFGNLEVLDKWIKMPEHMYQGRTKRSVWLSEAGLNSRSYSDEDLAEQAAGYAYAWKKIEALDGIDAHQWHNWFDNPSEGLNIGLRKQPYEPYNAERKPVWYVYQAAGTENEDEVFNPYLQVIGIPDWNIIEAM